MRYILGRLLTASSCTPKPAQKLNCCCSASRRSLYMLLTDLNPDIQRIAADESRQCQALVIGQTTYSTAKYRK